MNPPLTDKIKFLKLEEIEPYQQFRFRRKFWEMSLGGNILWPLHENVKNRIFLDRFLFTQKVAILKKDELLS